MSFSFSEFLVVLLALSLAIAAALDIRSRTIPNWLTLGIALAAIPFWWASDLAVWPDVAMRVGVAGLVFAVFALAFSLKMMGGGDVKLLAALALWLPTPAVMILLVLMSIAGGVLTLVMLVRHRMRKAQGRIEVPYGVAIAFGGLWLIGERFLNQFG
jgi:prepilin peptidase CpaA